MSDLPVTADDRVASAAPTRRRIRLRAPAARLWRPILMTVLSTVLFLALWELASRTIVNPYLVPPPSRVAQEAWPMILSGTIFSNAAISLWRVFVGFVLGSAAAILIGVPMGRLRLVNELLDPVIEFLRYISPTAMIPIAIIWFGIGEASKYFLIFWGTFFFVLVNTVSGVMRVPATRVQAAQCLGASRLRIFLTVVLPSSVPAIVTGMRVAMASSFMSIIPAEMLAANSGLGYLLQTAGMLAQTERIFVALATISILGFATDRLFRKLVTLTLGRYVTPMAER